MSQPDPQPNDHPSMHDEVRDFILLTRRATPWRDKLLAELEARKKRGLETYKTLLQPFNGRDALQDAFEEALDLAVYLQQAICENAAGDTDHALALDLRDHLFRVTLTCDWLAQRISHREDKQGRRNA